MRSLFKVLGKLIAILIIVLLIIVVIGIVIAGAGKFYLNHKISKVQYEEIPETQIEIPEGVDLKQKGYRNIAIFGVDARTDTYDTRSDCIMIVSMNEENGIVKIVSVYRDTYVNIDGHGLDKITHAYAFGGPSLAISTINKNFDLDIKEHISVNFDAVQKIIDAVGGIEMSITNAEVPLMHSSRIKTGGIYNLNGAEALSYSRIRYLAGGDYKRTERMRDVLIATANKAKTLNPSELNKMLDTLLPEVRTNIKEKEIKEFIANSYKYKINFSVGWPYEVRGITLDRWYGVPVTLESNVTRLHQEVFEEHDYIPSENVINISNDIIRKTGYK